MTGTTRSSDGLDPRRRKLLFRSWHRGLREIDLIFGSFADAQIHCLTETELDQYERLLDVPDPEILPWVTGGERLPEMPERPILEKIIAFRRAMIF